MGSAASRFVRRARVQSKKMPNPGAGLAGYAFSGAEGPGVLDGRGLEWGEIAENAAWAPPDWNIPADDNASRALSGELCRCEGVHVDSAFPSFRA